MDKMKMNDEMMSSVSGGTVVPYVVQPGDTLSVIAQKFNVSVDQLMKWNGIQNPNIIAVGQKVEIKF